MILGIVVLLALALAQISLLWKSLYERTIRWKLYALRDDLRYRGLTNPAVLASPLFNRLDRALTSIAGNLNGLSLWSLTPVMLSKTDPEIEAQANETVELLRQPENSELQKIYNRSLTLLMYHLCVRHILLTTLLAVTVVGVLLSHWCLRWVSQRLLTGALPAVLPSTMVDRRRAA
jgi:hypothetical protein